MQSIDFSRTERLSDLFKHEIADVLRNKVRDPRLSNLTILQVRVTPDLRNAVVSFSATNSFNDIEIEEVKRALSKAKGFIRKSLSKTMKLKRIPEISFELTDSYLFQL
tara:strand:- start:73920 stop:74243 length:324 start_codon:yes stop_codon:yes gene_type:complete